MGSLLAVLGAATALLVPAGNGDIVVTRDALPLPASCSVVEAAALVTGFLDAFNRGDVDELERLFAPAGEGMTDFKWYSSEEGGRQPAIYERGRLLDYFRERHRHAETMRLVSLDLGPGRGSEVGLSYVLIRQADDVAGRFTPGKGQIDCARRQIYVWSMGRSSDTGSPTTCPTPAGWTPGTPALACTRGPNARAVAPGFVVPPAGRPADRCRAGSAFRTIRAMLSAFNIGNAASFRVGLAPRATFSPAGRNLGTRGAIQDFVGHRYSRAGEGWTLTRLEPRPGVGRFALSITVSRLGTPVGRGVATVALDCRTGLVRSWSGPALRLH